MMSGNLKMAINALRSSKWRSLLTMLGIIIGVVSVVTTVSIGEGIRQQVSNQISYLGDDLITVRAGREAGTGGGVSVTSGSLFSGISGSTLSKGDIDVVKDSEAIEEVAPIGISSGVPQVANREFVGGNIIATNESLPSLLNQDVEFGAFFTEGETTRHVAVIGTRVAEQLFQESVPVGRTLTIRGEDFIVRGVFEEFRANPLAMGADLNSAVFIPLPVAEDLTDGIVPLPVILANSSSVERVELSAESITSNLREARAGQEDFTVLTQEESLEATDDILALLTQMVTGIAAISLLVGGIGVMNIMLVSVTERTREIGVRKAIGATNRQILNQFLIEAIMLSIVGGVIGIAMSLLANFLLRILTDLTPVITLPVVLIATGVSLSVGIVFGVMPAVRAATKDPIDALRYE